MGTKAAEPKARNRAGKVTLRDVADALGVSKATVSLALNGSELVAQKTRDRVLAKIDELGYVYNRGAAGLSTGVTRTIGLAIHDITNPYFSEVCAAIEEVLSEGGRIPYLCNTDESLERQQRFIAALAEHNADGLILCPAVGTRLEHLGPMIEQGRPVVLIARDIVGAPLDFVGNDDRLGLRMVTEHLIGLGHRRIAMLGGGQPTSAGKLRRGGYFDAMRDHGLAVDPELVLDCPTSPDGGAEGLKVAMANPVPPTAVACFSDLVALGALSALYELDLVPGESVAVAGCDGIAEGGRAYARLTTACIQKAAIGRAAARILVQRLSQPDLDPQRIILKPELIVRGSSGTRLGAPVVQRNHSRAFE